jgi:subtilisin family serine protease
VTGLVAALLPVGLAAGLSQPAVAQPAVTQPGAVFELPADPAGRSVTLITGDRVLLTERAGRLTPTRIEPGPGRTSVAFTTSSVGGRLRVVPLDARPLLRAGRLDPDLFDLTALTRFGYDDRRADLPLLVMGDAAGVRVRTATVSSVAPARPLRGGAAVRAGKRGLGTAWRSLVSDPSSRQPRAARGTSDWKVWLDGLLTPALRDSVPQIGAPDAWSAGFTGAGIKVGVVDSGVDTQHPDLAGQVVAAQNFIDGEDLRDITGHGTHVASTIAGTGAAAPGGYKGVAPGARLVSARACNLDGCPISSVLAAMQWTADQGVKIINMSLGGLVTTPGPNPLVDAVERITREQNVLFVVAAGNDGELGDSSLSAPGTADSALTVGAVSKSDELAEFSSRGPRLGDGVLKPDITAPGVAITAAKSADGPDAPGPDPLHATKPGTSMAAPHVSGSVAVLAGEHPDWTAAQLKAALMGSARTSPSIGVYSQGAGRVDLTRGITQRVLADPPSVSVLDQWPLEAAPTVRTVTYHNTGTAPVTLDLHVQTAAAAGVYTVAEPALTVPAGGSADAHLAVDTRAAGVARFSGGWLVATAGDTTVTTPFAAAVETEPTYAVHVDSLDRDGAAARDTVTALVDTTTAKVFEVTTNTADLRVPQGHYVVMSLFANPVDDTTTVLVDPDVAVTGDRHLTRDARLGQPVRVRQPVADAAPVSASVYTQVALPAGILYSIGATSVSPDVLRLGPANPHGSNPAVESGFTMLETKQGGDPADSPYVVGLSWHEKGRMFPGLRRTVTPNQLATVQAAYARHALDSGIMRYQAQWPGSTVALTDVAAVRLPGARVEYFNTDGGVQRQMSLVETGAAGTVGNTLTSPVRTFAGGRQYAERRNAGVYGPGFAAPPLAEGRWVTRRGDTLRIAPTLVDDRLGWAGFATVGDTPRLTVDRDGQRLFDARSTGTDLAVPPGPSDYHLTADLVRGAGKELATHATAEWTIRSDTTDTDQWQPLTLWVVRFLPALDDNNQAPAGAPFAVPFDVRRQAGSVPTAIRTLSVDVSYNDGATWHPAPVKRDGQQGVALLTHPSGNGFVSLRAGGVDDSGATVRVTVLRAYRIG